MSGHLCKDLQHRLRWKTQPKSHVRIVFMSLQDNIFCTGRIQFCTCEIYIFVHVGHALMKHVGFVKFWHEFCFITRPQHHKSAHWSTRWSRGLEIACRNFVFQLISCPPICHQTLISEQHRSGLSQCPGRVHEKRPTSRRS